MGGGGPGRRPRHDRDLEAPRDGRFHGWFRAVVLRARGIDPDHDPENAPAAAHASAIREAAEAVKEQANELAELLQPSGNIVRDLATGTYGQEQTQ